MGRWHCRLGLSVLSLCGAAATAADAFAPVQVRPNRFVRSLHRRRALSPPSSSFSTPILGPLLGGAPIVDAVVVARRASSSSSSGGGEFVSEEGGTVLELTEPSTGRLVTLIGTAHLSQKSNDQVTSVIEAVRPDVVMIELDESRLDRIGINPDELTVPYITADDIVPPPTPSDVEFESNRPWWNFARELFLDAVTSAGRSALTSMYDDLSSGLGDDVVGGGEFLAAVRAAERTKDPACRRIVLGDRDSLLTLRRAADLALRSGDPLGVVGRLTEANGEEMEAMEDKVREGMPEGAKEAEVTAAMIEAIKADDKFRSRVFGRLEKEVPEFTQAFLTERDFIMAEAIYRERDAKHIVAVLGLAHLPGVAQNLEACFRRETAL